MKRATWDTHCSPCEILHDDVFAMLQVLHHVVFESGLGFNEALDHLVEVESVQLEHTQDPGEAQIRFY